MKNPLFIIVIFVVLIGLVSLSGCKSAEAASYTLTVTVGDGVSGTPVTGSTSYGENDTVTYSYTAQSGYGNLAVTLDGAPVANSGTITMTANHTLNATAVVDIRGNWTGRLYWNTGDYNLQIHFSGGILSGTLEGNTDAPAGPGNKIGTYTVNGDSIEFNLHFFMGTLLFDGTIENAGQMSGPWVTDNEYSNGNWTLSRQI